MLGHVRSLSILSATTDNSVDISITSTREPKTSVYNDNWFDRLAIRHLSQSLQSSTGIYTSPPSSNHNAKFELTNINKLKTLWNMHVCIFVDIIIYDDN